MTRWVRLLSTFALAGCWLGLAGLAWAVFPPPVKDDGKFFSKEGLVKANEKIRDIYKKYRKDVVVETVPSLSPEQERGLKDDGEKKFFARMELERSRELGLDGVYILVVRKPRWLGIHMDPDTQKKAFTPTNRKAAFDKIVAEFRNDEFDAGLHAGLEAIEAALKANKASR